MSGRKSLATSLSDQITPAVLTHALAGSLCCKRGDSKRDRQKGCQNKKKVNKWPNTTKRLPKKEWKGKVSGLPLLPPPSCRTMTGVIFHVFPMHVIVLGNKASGTSVPWNYTLFGHLRSQNYYDKLFSIYPKYLGAMIAPEALQSRFGLTFLFWSGEC